MKEDIKRMLQSYRDSTWELSAGSKRMIEIRNEVAECVLDLIPQWISVKDKMPEDNWAKPLADFSGMKIVANSAGVDIAFYNRLTQTWYTDCPAESIEWIDKITHWMPLPGPPKVG